MSLPLRLLLLLLLQPGAAGEAAALRLTAALLRHQQLPRALVRQPRLRSAHRLLLQRRTTDPAGMKGSAPAMHGGKAGDTAFYQVHARKYAEQKQVRASHAKPPGPDHGP